MHENELLRFYEYMLIHAISMLDYWCMLKDLHVDMLIVEIWEKSSWAMMNTMKMIEIISRNVFWSFKSCFQRPACVCEYMNMYWSMVAYAWQNDWSWHVWPCTISIDRPTGLMKRSVSSSLARHIWISPHFDSGSQHYFKRISHFLFSLHTISMCLLHVLFIFFLTSKIHK